MQVTIFTPEGNDRARSVAQSTVDQLRGLGHGCSVVVVAPTGELDRSVVADADLVVTFGGDGTFLRGAVLAHAASIPVLGVNFGRLGYLLPIDPEDVEQVIARGVAEGFSTRSRAVLEVRTPSASMLAVNEVVVEKGEPGHMLRLGTAIDGEPFVSYAADGVLVATPTGSTAYNLSAGGPVLATELRAMVLTPVAPHLAVDRSVVLSPERTVGILVHDSRGASVVVDGRPAGRLRAGESIEVTVHQRSLEVVVGSGLTLARRLRAILSPANLEG